MPNPQLVRAWTQCVDAVKDKINNRSLWAALEKTSAITIEGDTLVLGYAAEDVSCASVIQHSATLHALSNVVQQSFGRRLEIKLIEGAEEADWEAYKEAQARAESIKKTALASRPSVSAADGQAAGSWDVVYDRVTRLFSSMPYRALPQGKARFANDALYILLDAMENLYPDPADDAAERSLARVLDRISHSSEIPAPVLAFELERLRVWRSGTE